MWASSVKMKATSMGPDIRTIDAPLDNWARFWAHTKPRWHHLSHITQLVFGHTIVQKAVKWPINSRQLLWEVKSVLWLYLCNVILFSFHMPVRVDINLNITFILQKLIFSCFGVTPLMIPSVSFCILPPLVTVLTADIVGVPPGFTISNPLCPWTVLNVRTLKQDRPKKGPHTIHYIQYTYTTTPLFMNL